jgi:hypothetical protein
MVLSLSFYIYFFGKKWFLQQCPKLPSSVRKAQGILGVKKPLILQTTIYTLLLVGIFGNKRLMQPFGIWGLKGVLLTIACILHKWDLM